MFGQISCLGGSSLSHLVLTFLHGSSLLMVLHHRGMHCCVLTKALKDLAILCVNYNYSTLGSCYPEIERPRVSHDVCGHFDRGETDRIL